MHQSIHLCLIAISVLITVISGLTPIPRTKKKNLIIALRTEK